MLQRYREAIFQRRDVGIQRRDVQERGKTDVVTLRRRDVENQRCDVTKKAKMQNFQQCSKVRENPPSAIRNSF